ncbi:hypothetical protein CFC21_110163 [Triticum aestivum]|uniref:Uncharacterized protein n=2 Tax=Triticum aestivum TaxID=4565 RepID=A0A3B6TU96_WHEAT|nr:hypothetical protein CFC21_110163 [Triticum aestivum]
MTYLSLLRRQKWWDALLVPEVVVRIHLALGHREPPEVTLEVLLTPYLTGQVAGDVPHNHILAKVKVPIVHIRLPGVAAHVRPHERVEISEPPHLSRSVRGGRPEIHVLDVVQHPTSVRERRRRIRQAADLPAVRVHDHQPGVRLGEPGENLHPHVLGDGPTDVVGRGLAEGPRGGGPVQDVLHGGGAAQVDVRHRLDPGHLLAVRPVQAELREAAAHQRQQRVGRPQVHGLEVGHLLLREHPDEKIFGESWGDLLPSGEDVYGALVDGLCDAEHCHCRRDGNELHLPREHDAEALAAATADGPEHVRPHGLLVQELPIGVNKRGVQDVVDGDAVLAQQHAEPAAAEMAAHADRRAQAGRESQQPARLRDGVVELPERRAGVHPRGGRLLVNAHGAEVRQVDHREHLGARGPVREALVVVPAAAHADAHVVPTAADDGGLDVGGVGRRDYAERPHRARRGELGVPDGGHQDRGERRRALRV